MKELKTIFESSYLTKRATVSKIQHAINDDWSNFRKNYREHIRGHIIDLCKSCGDNSKYHTYFFNPVTIKFDYNIKGGCTPGLMFAIWLDKDDEPVLYVDCLDGGKPFGISIDKIMDSSSMFRLRNNVLIDSANLYDLLNRGYLHNDSSKDECKEIRQKEYERFTSDGGQLADRLRDYLKKQDYDEIIKSLKQLVETKGEKYRDGKSIRLKRIGRSWNNHISEIILINNELWVNVYWQGDLTDGDEEIRLSWILKDKKYVIKHRDERFTVDHDSVKDMFDDLEHYLMNTK